MFHYKRDLFDFFPDEKILQKFCDEINRSDADAFILMAHKAVQLVQVLLDQEHIDERITQKIIISSQALDFDCEYLRNKKIAIIDDIVISGTSIASAVHKLLNVGVIAERIDIIALARDKKYQTMVFQSEKGHDMLHCATLLDDAACIELSYLISTAFSYYGMPYDTDFPTYAPIEVRAEHLPVLCNQLFWHTESPTNSDQQTGEVTPFVLFPKQNVLKLLWEKIGVNLSDCVHVKIRAYVRRYPSGRQECSIVPMCLFDEISETDLEMLYRIFAPQFTPMLLNQDRLHVAQMRYVEYYISHHIYLTFLDITSLSESNMPTETSMRLLFGYSDGEKVYSSLSRDISKDGNMLSVKPIEYLDTDMVQEFLSHEIGQEMIINIAKAEALDVDEQKIWVNRIVLAPFVWWYDSKELPVREKVRFPVKHYIQDYAIIEDALERLRSGFSLNTLQYLLSENLTNDNARLFISLFLDHAIDRGIIVPTIFHNTSKHYLCRAYRHGEDLPFSLEDECRLVYFLKELCDRIPDVDALPSLEPSDNGLAEISFEKMIVLFYQMGTRNGGIFNHFLGFNNIKILKPFLSLHGTIQAFVDPEQMREWGINKTHFYSEKDSSGNRYITWLTNWAKDKGFAWNPKDKDGNKTSDILLNGDKIRSYLESNGRSCISDSIACSISDIAYMIAKWYNTMIQNGEKAKFKDDATALTSCSNAHVFVSAIATELHYYKKFWHNQVARAFEDSANNNAIKYSLTNKENDNRNTANIIQGLNSGRKKVEWYSSGAAKRVVYQVKDILKDTGSSNWMAFWKGVEETPEHTSSQLSNYIHQTLSFLYFYSACNDCLTYTPFWQTGEHPPYYDDFQSEYRKTSESVQGELELDWFCELNTLSTLEDFGEKKRQLFGLVERALITSENLVDDIECEIEKNAEDYTISYRSAIIFEVDALNSSCVEDKIMEVWNKQEDLDRKTQLNIVEFSTLEESANYKRYGIFYGISVKCRNELLTQSINYTENGKVLLSIYQQLCHAFNGRAKSIRAIFIPHTPVNRVFKHSVQRKIKENVDRFDRKLVLSLINMYVHNSTHQMLVAMTDSVDRSFGEIFRDLRWKRCKDLRVDESNKMFSKIVVYYSDYFPFRNSDKMERIFNSTVRIQCDTNWGMGLLVKTNNQVVCVSCNHILKDYKEAENVPIFARADNDVSFKLRPLKSICIAENDLEGLSAENEIAVLEPVWDIQIPFDVRNIISIDDLNVAPLKDMDKECRCCGCVNNSTRVWKSELKVLGKTDNGYYQMDDPQKTLGKGCSGGVTIIDPQNPTIVGLHKGRIRETVNRRRENNEYPQLIPSAVIKDEIMKLEEEQ